MGQPQRLWTCWETPGGEPTGKPVLVFLHGWGGSSRYWRSTAQALADCYDSLRIDWCGFGEAADRADGGDFRLTAYADDLQALLQSHDLGPVTLVAHSMGCSVAALLLEQWPEGVHRAVLTCGGVFDYQPQAFALFQTLSQGIVRLRPAWLPRVPGMAPLFMARFLHRPLDAAEQQAFLEDFVRADERAASGTLRDCFTAETAAALPRAYGAIACPTLLLSGECDRIIPADLGAAAAALNPRLEHRVLPQVGHFPMLEDPEGFRVALATFLDP
jgi:pimeloyl-ACP methyl ester carboxylesterase